MTKPSQQRGFSLFEVVIALAVFAVGIVAVLTLYSSNIRAARQTKAEIALALVRREIRTRTQLAAFNAADVHGKSTFANSEWLLRDPAATEDPGDPQPLDGVNPRPPTPDILALNAQDWNVVKGRFDAVCPDARWDENAICAGFQFRMRTVLPSEAENTQFTDIDGYDIWDSAAKKLSPNIHSDEVQGQEAPLSGHAPVRPPDASRAKLPAGAVNAGFFGPPRSSHGAVYDPRGMKQYLKRIKCVIGWDLTDRSDIFSGQNDVFYFTVYNPDARKQQP